MQTKKVIFSEIDFLRIDKKYDMPNSFLHKKINELPTNFLNVCAPKWDPKIFSIIVHVQYDNVFYALYAIISAEKIHRLYFI